MKTQSVYKTRCATPLNQWTPDRLFAPVEALKKMSSANFVLFDEVQLSRTVQKFRYGAALRRLNFVREMDNT
jgi:hypothetical protein